MENPEKSTVEWSGYLRYRADLRGFELEKVEKILRYSVERYFDTGTRRMIAVGRHDNSMVIVPYEEKEDTITPITIHATTRQQINFRLKTGRFVT